MNNQIKHKVKIEQNYNSSFTVKIDDGKELVFDRDDFFTKTKENVIDLLKALNIPVQNKIIE